MNVEKAVRMAVDTGKVQFGSESARNAVLKTGAKLLVVSSNCNEEVKHDLQRLARLSQVPVFVFQGSSIELGSVCGKPFPVSALSVFEPGDSNILELAGKQ